MNIKYRNPEWLKEQFRYGKSAIEIAKMCGVSNDTITRWLRKSGIYQIRIIRIFDNKKKCDGCNKLLPLDNFLKRSKKHSCDGYSHVCKKCQNERYADNRRKYNKKPDVIKRRRKVKRIYGKKRRENIKHRVGNSISARMNKVLKDGKLRNSWTKLAGYTVDELSEHLEYLWEPWMSWKNWGVYDENHKTWHIDHIRPIASFNIISFDCDDFKKCWSLKNLRPLLASDNHSKGSKYTGVIE